MEEYLQYMKTLRSQINDVENEAANISAEEQIHLTTIQNLENDTLSAKSKTMQLKEDTEKMLKAKGEICSHIIGQQRKIASLNSQSSTLTKTLELLQQEKISLSSKLKEKSTYYSTVAKDLSNKLQQQQDWVESQKLSGQIEEHANLSIKNHSIKDNVNTEAGKDLIVKLDLAKAKLHGIAQRKAKLVADNAKIKDSIGQAKCRANHFKPELLEINIMTLEKQYKTLLSDKDGETEYLCSLQDKVENVKGISHAIKCICGEEYKLNLCA